MLSGSKMSLGKLVWTFIMVGLAAAQVTDKVPITVVTLQPLHAESRNPYPAYYCYLSSPAADTTVTARRVSNTRSSADNNPDPPSPQNIFDTRYPAGTAVYKVPLSFNDNSQSYAFGTFSCDVSKHGRNPTNVSNIVMNSNVLSSPSDGLVTQTVNRGESDVEIRMKLSPRYKVKRWLRNGRTFFRPDTGSVASNGTLFVGNNVQKNSHEGVYEAVTDFTSQPRRQPRHGLKRLIVHSCQANHWGPPDCAGICDICYNGGVCDDETGRCICPPGFMGTNCLTACGGNRFGYRCEFQCSYDGDDEDSCSGLQFCLLDPFGCRCNTGWKDLSCEIACSAGTFGASCLQDCHCNGDCNRFTGLCNGTCEAGWTGDSCQMECSGGFFGESCLEECRCDVDACNKVTGNCSGQCKPQWVDSYQCLAGLDSITSSKANPNGTSEVSCVMQVHRDSSSNLTVLLSRQCDKLEDSGLEFIERTNDTSKEVWMFTAAGVREGDELFCLVLDQRDRIAATLNTTVMEYELPLFNSSPTLVIATATSITIRWNAWDPDRDDGDPPVVAYIPCYKEAASPEWIHGPMVSSGKALEYQADDLEADTEYSFSVAAVREGVNGKGPMGPAINLRTKCDVSDVTPYKVMAYVDLTTASAQINISWQSPQEGDLKCSSGVSFFSIYFKKEGSTEGLQLLTQVEANETWIIVDTDDLGEGEFSFFVSLTIDEESALGQGSTNILIMQPDGGGSFKFDTILFVMLICVAVFVVGVALMAVFFRKKGRKGNSLDGNTTFTPYDNTGVSLDSGNEFLPVNGDNQAKDTTFNEEQSIMAVADGIDEDNVEGEGDDLKEFEIVYSNLQTPEKVKVSELRDYINSNLQEGMLEQEFSLLKKGKQYPWTVAEKMENRAKNRFRNLYTYDHSRVILEALSDYEHSDYYNASYITDVSDRKIFIAAQGPNEASLNDFWRMVWSENVSTIVMVTNLIESGKDRCQRYWPDEYGVSQAIGDIVISLEGINYFADYVIRKLHVVHHGDQRIIHQLHYISWPDMGTPKQPTPLIAFVKQAKLIHKDKQTPMVVHCSAGTGRTGTFIALYSLLDNILSDEYVDVFDCVRKMRENRVNMVQTGRQYIFLYKCLLEASLTSETEIARDDISKIASDQQRLRGEFQLLEQFKEDDVAYSNYLKQAGITQPISMCELCYNLSQDIPANFLKSFKKEDGYITCAYPKPDTIDQFWRLVHTWKCSIIVMLDQLDANKVPYWIQGDSSKKYSVCCKQTEIVSAFILRQLEVSQDDGEDIVSVNHLQLILWPARDNCSGLGSIIRKVISLQKSAKLDGPVVVHCVDGEGLSGIFVAVSSEIERLQLTGKMDMFKTVRQLRETNTNVLASEEDYLLCYNLLSQYLEEPHTYQNI